MASPKSRLGRFLPRLFFHQVRFSLVADKFFSCVFDTSGEGNNGAWVELKAQIIVPSNTLVLSRRKASVALALALPRPRLLFQRNLPRIRFHVLRHTAASLMINRGISIVVISKILGHSNSSVTLNIYVHCVSENQYETTKVMEEITTPMAIDIQELPLKN
jgi:hypothetical protein